MTRANLVVEEAFVNVQCKSEQREQTSSEGDHCMAAMETSDQAGQERGDGRRILIVHHFVPEVGQSFGPDVLSIQVSLVPNRGRDGVFPTNIKTLMEIPSVLRVTVLC